MVVDGRQDKNFKMLQIVISWLFSTSPLELERSVVHVDAVRHPSASSGHGRPEQRGGRLAGRVTAATGSKRVQVSSDSGWSSRNGFSCGRFVSVGSGGNVACSEAHDPQEPPVDAQVVDHLDVVQVQVLVLDRVRIGLGRVDRKSGRKVESRNARSQIRLTGCDRNGADGIPSPGCRLSAWARHCSGLRFYFKGTFLLFRNFLRLRRQTAAEKQNWTNRWFRDSTETKQVSGLDFFRNFCSQPKKGLGCFGFDFGFGFGVGWRIASRRFRETSLPSCRSSLKISSAEMSQMPDSSETKLLGKKIVFVAASASDKFCLDKRWLTSRNFCWSQSIDLSVDMVP